MSLSKKQSTESWCKVIQFNLIALQWYYFLLFQIYERLRFAHKVNIQRIDYFKLPEFVILWCSLDVVRNQLHDIQPSGVRKVYSRRTSIRVTSNFAFPERHRHNLLLPSREELRMIHSYNHTDWAGQRGWTSSLSASRLTRFYFWNPRGGERIINQLHRSLDEIRAGIKSGGTRGRRFSECELNQTQ